MSIPLDRLYHYVKHIAEEIQGDNVIIYRFFPHGSKNIEDLSPLTQFDSWLDSSIHPQVFCNDQEPLNFNLYQTPVARSEDKLAELVDRHCCLPNHNIRGRLVNLFDHAILLHSEKNSAQVELYQKSGFFTAYYWSHAVIARDWFRFAEHTQQKKSVGKKFLIYNRAWSGTREYRLKFAELLIRLGLEEHCQTTVNPVEPELGQHYDYYKFKNPQWKPTHVLENFFPTSNATSTYSADFDIVDYESTDIEVILETLFDDSRLHLTEKTLRPIALGQPFILAGTAGSLQYLHDYGFKTFGHLWDERYDFESDPYLRMSAIIDVMQRIATWTPAMRESKLAQAQDIANYNKKHFFSKEFHFQITKELTTNLRQAIVNTRTQNTGQTWIDQINELSRYDSIQQLFNNPRHALDPTPAMLDYVTRTAHQYNLPR